MNYTFSQFKTGQKFTAEYGHSFRVKFSGVVFVGSNRGIYLLNNEVSGSKPPSYDDYRKFNYKYSRWVGGINSNYNEGSQNVYNLIIKNTKDKDPRVNIFLQKTTDNLSKQRKGVNI